MLVEDGKGPEVLNGLRTPSFLGVQLHRCVITNEAVTTELDTIFLSPLLLSEMENCNYCRLFFLLFPIVDPYIMCHTMFHRCPTFVSMSHFLSKYYIVGSEKEEGRTLIYVGVFLIHS